MIDLESISISNTKYRKTIFTTSSSSTSSMQLVLMSLKPMEGIGKEVHPNITQFIRVEKGRGIAIVGNKIYDLKKGSAIIIPEGVCHNVVNMSKKHPMKLYTIYTPSHHKKNCIQSKKSDLEC